MPKRRFYHVAASAVLAALPVAARGIVYESTGDVNFNTTAPTGSLANSGWQYQINTWAGGELATPIAPHYLVSALHLLPNPNQGVGASYSYNGENYTVTAVVGTFGDLRVYQVDNSFKSFAPMYDIAADGLETGANYALNKNAVMIGRGGGRGTEVHVNNDPGQALLGWNWAAADGVKRWGENKVVAVDSSVIQFDFDRSGTGYTGVNESALVGGDSGGGVFINSNGEWKLAGINYSVSGYYRYTANGANFVAALYDTRGLYSSPTGTGTGTLITGGSDLPSSWYASRIASNFTNIKNLIDLNPTWKTNSNATWDANAGNWSYSTPSNAIGSIVDFRTAITAARTVTLSGAKTVGTINFDNSNSYTLTGGSIAFDTNLGNAQVNVASGNHTIASPVTLNDNFDVNVIQYPVTSVSTLSFTGTFSAAGRTINKMGLGTAEFKNILAATLNNQQGTTRILADGTSNGTSKVSTLSITGGSVDLTNNDMVVASGSLGTLTSQIATGRNGGAWNGAGLNSSTAATQGGRTGLGIAVASSVLSFAGGPTQTWSGQTVDANSILIKYTWAGDLNLSGNIDGDDYFRIDTGYVQHLSGYVNGDVNYDNRIDADDYFWIDSNYSHQAGLLLATQLNPQMLGAVAAVPEPAMIGSLLLAVPILLRRRRRS